MTTTGERAAASFIVVLTVRDEKIAYWREYQDTRGMAISLGQLAALGIPLNVSLGSGVDDGGKI